MISSLDGTVLATGNSHVVIGVGGVGFRVEVPASAVGRLAAAGRGGSEVHVEASLVVKEDSLTL